VARRREHAKQEYAEEKEQLVEELAEARDVAIEGMTEAAAVIQANLEEHRQIIERRRGLRRAFLSHLDQLESAGNALLQYYRQESRRTRPSGSEAPTRFNHPWTMTRPTLEEDDGSDSILVSPDSIRSTLARKGTQYYREIRTELRGVNVTVSIVPRETKRSAQDRKLLAFWTAYFADQGGVVDQWRPIKGGAY
jgi:hypothetical protein